MGLAVGGLALDAFAPDTLDAYIQALTSQLPAGGAQFVDAAITSLRPGATALLALAIIVAIFTGSRLFIALENCFAVIYRLGDRPSLSKNVTAILMTVIYALLAPLAFVASGQLSNLIQFLYIPFTTATGQPAQAPIYLPPASPTEGALTYLTGVAAGVFIAFILFYAMYLVVPNRPLVWRRDLTITWRGALVAALLLNLYEQLFPLYQHLFLGASSYSSVAGLAIVAVLFLYFIGFISLLGAEINAWSEGLRPLGATLPDLFRQRDKSNR